MILSDVDEIGQEAQTTGGGVKKEGKHLWYLSASTLISTDDNSHTSCLDFFCSISAEKI